MYTVGDFMTRKEDLHVVKPTTTVDEGMCHTQRYVLQLYYKSLAFSPMYSDTRSVNFQTALEILVENRITGFPVIDDDWKLVTFPYPSLSHLCLLYTLLNQTSIYFLSSISTNLLFHPRQVPC